MSEEEPKPDRERDMTAGLLRQRRNLIAVSVILFFYNLGGLKITKINILGNYIEVGNPSIFSFALWLFFTYFLYRYWLYFKEEPMGRYEYDYRARLDQLCLPLFRKIALRQNNQKYSEEKLIEILKEREFSLHKSGNYKSLSFLKAESNAIKLMRQGKHDDEHVTAVYYKFMFWPFHIVVNTKMAYTDSRFSDYYLPFIFSFIAVFSWFWSLL